MKNSHENDFLCPSAPLTEDSFLFGILNEKAEVHYIDSIIPMTEDLLHGFSKVDDPEKHFRFTMTCGQENCAQWSDNKCSIGSAIHKADIEELDTKPVQCGIRKACRWYAQEGLSACGLCKYIVTDVSL